MAALLAKFRIDFSSVLVIPGRKKSLSNHLYLMFVLDVTKRASEESRTKLNAKLAELPVGTIPEVNFQHSMIFYQEELVMVLLFMMMMIIMEHTSQHHLLPGGVGQQQGKDQ